MARRIHLSAATAMKAHLGYRLVTNGNEPHRDKTNKMTCAPSEDSDQPGHPPSLIRVFAVHLMGS